MTSHSRVMSTQANVNTDPLLTNTPPVDPSSAAIDTSATTTSSSDDGESGLISTWIEITNKQISSNTDPVQLSRILTLGEWDCERTPCFCLTFKVRPARAPKWFYHSINLNKKEAEWFKQNSGVILSRRPQRHDIKNKEGIVMRTVTTETQTIKGIDRLVITQVKNGKEFRPFRLAISKAGDFIRAISDSLDEFQTYLNKQYDEEDSYE